jgi:colanic acid/amylovoran biosynthesis glycosyltransferase
MGPLNHDQFLHLLSQACAFVQHSVTPSWGDAEGTPNSVLEAQAAGLPVIPTHHAGINEAVVHWQTGYLVPERDLPGMTQNMIRLQQNPTLSATLGSAARKLIENNYSIKKHLELIEQSIALALSASY